MALSATIYHLTLELADIDRGVYETIDLRVARQPSETPAYMLMRVLAYALEYVEGIALTEGVAAGDDPAIVVRDLTGRVTKWIEVGMPDAGRVHRGSKLAGQVAIYTHRDIRQVLAQLASSPIHKSEDISIFALDRAFVDEVSALIDRRTTISLSITERQLYLSLGERTMNTPIVEHRIGAPR